MARVVVVFGTTDGQTARIARAVADVLISEQHQVDVVDLRDAVQAQPLAGADAVIVAGSVRMGKFQRALVAFAREHRDTLEWLPNAFIAVSLSASRDTEPAKREVRKTVARFVAETGFTPRAVVPVAGALLYSRYGSFTRLAMCLISKMSGGDTDTSRDYEYTDWSAVADFARRFAAELRAAPISPDGPPAAWRADAAL